MKKVRMHDLRHFHALILIQEGSSPVVISQRQGHSGIAITADIYTHADIDVQTEAVKAFEDSVSGL